MLDLPTTLITLSVMTALQGFVWVLVWLTQRHLYELKVIAAGFMAFAVGLLFMVSREAIPGAAFIILYNVIINAGIAMLADGTARFLGRPPYRVITVGTFVFTILFWPAALMIAPENVAIRIIASNSVIIVLLLHISVTFALDRTQPAIIRWTGIVVMLGDSIGLVLRSLHAVRNFHSPTILNDNASQALYFFSATVFTTSFFLVLLLMVGIRLSSDLRQKNDALTHEVSERRKLQEQLAMALATEKRLREEQRQLLRMVTHEFRTPLAVVDRAAEMIAVVLPEPPDAVARRLDSIRQAVRRLVQLIDRFLDAERLEQEAMQPEEIDLLEFMSRVARHFDMMGSGHRLAFSVAEDLPPYFGDQDMLATVVINLIENALKYSPEEAPVTVSIRAAGGDIMIGVKDQGIGIPEAERRSVGRRFFRASNTQAATGTGLGLYNARKLLEYHQGELRLDAAPGGGTIALIRLPLRMYSPILQEAVA